jgi:hypothetical protein
MAAPVPVGGVATSSGTGTTAPVATISAATALNDILIAEVVGGDSTSEPTLGGTYNGGAWTRINGAAWTTGAGAFYWSRATGNHSGQTITATTVNSGVIHVVRVTGCTTSGSPLDANMSAATLGAVAGGALTGFNTTVADTLVCYVGAVDDNQTISSPTKGGAAMALSSAVSSGGADSGVWFASLAQAAAGATGNFAITNAAGTASGKRVAAFALKPPAVTTREASMSLSATATVTIAPASSWADQLTSVGAEWSDTSGTFSVVSGVAYPTGAIAVAQRPERIDAAAPYRLVAHINYKYRATGNANDTVGAYLTSQTAAQLAAGSFTNLIFVAINSSSVGNRNIVVRVNGTQTVLGQVPAADGEYIVCIALDATHISITVRSADGVNEWRFQQARSTLTFTPNAVGFLGLDNRTTAGSGFEAIGFRAHGLEPISPKTDLEDVTEVPLYFQANGQTLRVCTPTDWVPGTALPILLWAASANANDHEPQDTAFAKALLDPILRRAAGGVAIVSCPWHGDSYGNDDVVADYTAVYTWLSTYLNVGSIIAASYSMGGLTHTVGISQTAVPVAGAFLSAAPFDLFTIQNLLGTETGHPQHAPFAAAWGLPSPWADADWNATDGPNHDPMDRAVTDYSGTAFKLIASYADASVPAATHGAPFRDKLLAGGIKTFWHESEGAHFDSTHLELYDLEPFVDDILGGVSTWDGQPKITATTAIAIAGEVPANQYFQSVNDSVGVSDQVTVLVGRAVIIGDSVILSDGPTTAAGWSTTQADSLQLADATSRGPGLAVADSLALADSLTRNLGREVSLADALTLADDTVRAVGRALTVADVLAVADALSTASERQIALNDALTLADSQTLARGVAQAVADTLTLADATSQEKTLTREIADTLSLTDAQAFAVEKAVADTLVLSDAQALQRAVQQALADTLTVADAQQIERAVQQALADTLTLADATAQETSLGRSIADSLSLADAVGLSAGKTLADALTLADNVVTERDIRQSLADSLALSDNVSKDVHKVVTDALVLADQQALARGIEYQHADVLAVTDTTSKDVMKAIEDAIGLSDAADAALFGPSGPYIHVPPPGRGNVVEPDLGGTVFLVVADGTVSVVDSTGLVAEYVATGAITDSATGLEPPANVASGDIGNQSASGFEV